MAERIGRGLSTNKSHPAVRAGADQQDRELAMAKNFPRSGKRDRPKTTFKGKRYRCAKCHKRSPKPIKTPAPWYCPKCLQEDDQSSRYQI